jgi:hypothetical protein
MPAATPVRLSASQRKQLKTIARGHKTLHRDRLRARIVLDATRYPNAAVARRCQVTENTVRRWRDRAYGCYDTAGAIVAQ